MARNQPSRGFRVRDRQRHRLTLHFILLIAGLVAAFFANRFLTPDTFWVQWVALGWGALFLIHLAYFARSTMATMGSRRR